MNTTYTFSSKLKMASFALIGVGLVAFIIGFTGDHDRGWASLLQASYYFLQLSIGAMFFYTIQLITQSGWSAMFKRIPEAMGSFLPVAAALLLVVFVLGAHDLYHWTHAEAVAEDALLKHKAPYLNLPFFYVRFVVFFGAWIVLYTLIRKNSLKEDEEGGVELFQKREFLAKIFIFVLAITFTMGTIDWIMSIDAHWFSTIYALKNLVGAFLHASSIILLIAMLLNRQGFFPELNKSHLHDFSKYMFMLCIVWGYFWFSQYFLIWYANIPEETYYYVNRSEGTWNVVFLMNLAINWLFPFLFLMWNRIAKTKSTLYVAIIALIIGQWIDLYEQIMPGAVYTGEHGHISPPAVGFAEIGAFLFVAGLFIFVVFRSLSKASLVPKNHPYLEESLVHHVH